MVQPEPRQPRTVTVELAASTDEWPTTSPYTYHIAGCEYNGSFGLGFQSQDPPPTHPDVIPDGPYQAITQRLKAELDLDAVQERTSEDTAPTIGRCTITEQADGRLEATIKLADDFLTSR